MDFVSHNSGNSGRTPAPQQPRPTSQPAPRVSEPAHGSYQRPAPRRSRKIIIIIAVVLIVLGLVAAFLFLRPGAALAVDSSKYQAVFFTNGQVYFGKLQAAGNDSFKLTNVFYLQSSQAEAADSKNPQATGSDQSGNNLQLIKLGAEIHGPEDAMIINRDQVLFYENLKADGTVSQKIKEYTQKNP